MRYKGKLSWLRNIISANKENFLSAGISGTEVDCAYAMTLFCNMNYTLETFSMFVASTRCLQIEDKIL